MKAPNSGGYLLPYWKIACNDKNNSGKIQNFIKSTRTNSPTSELGAISLPLSVMRLCILRHHLIIIVILFLSASNEQILIRLLKLLSIITDSQF